MIRAVFLTISCLTVASALAGPLPTPSPAETRAELDRVCRQLREGRNPVFGEAQVAELLALVPAQTAPADQVGIRAALARELFRLGRIRESIPILEEALEIHGRAGLDPAGRPALLSLLALSRLRGGEEDNCVALHTGASCIFPIEGGGVHAHPGQSRAAGDLYLKVLEADPDDVTARWLLNVARMASGDFPQGVPARFRIPESQLAPQTPFPRWRDVAPGLGVDVRDLAGGGVMDDFDGDGLLDLVSSTMDPCGSLKAFRNDGKGGFEDVTAAWGLDGQLGGLYLVQTDYDNDGRLDLYVARGGWMGEDGRVRDSLLRNELGGPSRRFADVTAAAGLAFPGYPGQAAAWADYDGDGDLDLFVGNETSPKMGYSARQTGLTGQTFPSQLFRNNGDGTFTDVARQAGVLNQRFAKGAAWGDYDDDGDPDLYVSNLGPNRLYRNNGDGTFADVAGELGVAAPMVSFPTWFFDADNDGDLDLLVADYSASGADVFASYFGAPAGQGHLVLYRNQGGRFADVSREMGLTRPVLPMGSNYGDLDNDGFPDIYLGTGLPEYEALMPNVMYRNDRGVRFEDVTFAGGFGHLQKGHGVAFGDLDNDGDQDLFLQVGGAYPYDAFANALYENPGPARTWLGLRLVGRKANRPGIGARIEVAVREGAGRRSVHVLAGSGGSFGANSLQQEIGLGGADAIESVTIRWPGSGTVQTLRELAPNRYYRVTEGEAAAVPLDLPHLRLAKP